MNRIDSIIARMSLIVVGVIIVCIIIESAANYWLWNIASERDFKEFASINQIKERFGDDYFTPDLEGNLARESPHHYLAHIPTPNLENAGRVHNDLGYRGGPVSIEKPAGTYRIITVGGSTTYSYGVHLNRETYPSLLEDYLHGKRFTEVEVINAGVTAYTSHQNLINIAFRVLPLDPDLIIIYQGWNDVSVRFVYPHSRYLADNSGSLRPWLPNTFMPAIWEYSTAIRILLVRTGRIGSPRREAVDAGELLASSNHLDEFARQIEDGTYPDGIFNEIPAEEMLAGNPPVHFERNLKNILAMAQSSAVDVLLVTMSLPRDFHARTGIETYKFISSDIFAHEVERHNDITRRIAASTATAIFDMAAVFPDDPALYTDGLHFTAAGNILRAQLIGDVIIDDFLQDRRQAGA